MACCRTALSHYLNQCWLSVNFWGIHLRAISSRQCSRCLSFIWVRKLLIQDYRHISQGPLSQVTPHAECTGRWIKTMQMFTTHNRMMFWNWLPLNQKRVDPHYQFFKHEGITRKDYHKGSQNQNTPHTTADLKYKSSCLYLESVSKWIKSVM